MKFPKDYRHTLLAGQTTEFEVKVHDVAEAVLPEVDAEFAKLLGIQDGDVARLRDETKANLEREAAARSRAVGARAYSKHCSMPIRLRPPGPDCRREPASETTRPNGAPTGGNRRRLPQPLSYPRGVGTDSGEVIRAKGLRVDAARVRARIEDMAAEYESPAEFVQWYYEKPERLAEIESLVMEERIVEEMLAGAEVVETPVGFQELLKLEASVR